MTGAMNPLAEIPTRERKCGNKRKMYMFAKHASPFVQTTITLHRYDGIECKIKASDYVTKDAECIESGLLPWPFFKRLNQPGVTISESMHANFGPPLKPSPLQHGYSYYDSPRDSQEFVQHGSSRESLQSHPPRVLAAPE